MGPLRPLDEVEAIFEKDRKKAKELVESCKLDVAEYENYVKSCLEIIYAAAGSQDLLVWQAEFAKRHGM
jgi:hypothetical protein